MGRREAFDPLQSYVANRTFAFGPRTYQEGDPFNERGDMRRLRQLYDGRYIRMAPVRTDAPQFPTMTEEQLRDWLTEAGFPGLAHPRSPHVRLVQRAQRVYAEQEAARLANPGGAPSKAPSVAARAKEAAAQPAPVPQAAATKPRRERLARVTLPPPVRERSHASRVRL